MTSLYFYDFEEQAKTKDLTRFKKYVISWDYMSEFHQLIEKLYTHKNKFINYGDNVMIGLSPGNIGPADVFVAYRMPKDLKEFKQKLSKKFIFPGVAIQKTPKYVTYKDFDDEGVILDKHGKPMW